MESEMQYFYCAYPEPVEIKYVCSDGPVDPEDITWEQNTPQDV
jgi:hypothetical protein